MPKPSIKGYKSVAQLKYLLWSKMYLLSNTAFRTSLFRFYGDKKKVPILHGHYILNNFKAKLVGDQIQLSQHNPQVDQSDVLE